MRKVVWPVFVLGGALIFWGLLALFSVSVFESFDLTLDLIASGNRDGEPSNYFYFGRQLRNLVVGGAVAAVFAAIPRKFLKKPAVIGIFFVCVFLLQLAVFVPGIGVTFQGARGWIDLGGVTTIQPAEFFKLGYVFFVARWLVRKKSELNDPRLFLKFAIWNFVFFVIFLLIPDLGSVMVMAPVGLLLLWYSGAEKKLLGVTVAVALALGIAGVGILSMMPRFGYISQRIQYFFSSDVDPQSRQIGWQNQQALLAIGGGGFVGQGYGKWLQKFGFIPEAQSDFIFAAFSEEVGFVGNFLFLAVFFGLMWFVLSRAAKIRDDFSRTIVVGLISLIVVQMLVNLGVNLKLLPNTGLTLPFVSYGGTAIMVNLIQLVLIEKILRVSK